MDMYNVLVSLGNGKQIVLGVMAASKDDARMDAEIIMEEYSIYDIIKEED